MEEELEQSTPCSTGESPLRGDIMELMEIPSTTNVPWTDTNKSIHKDSKEITLGNVRRDSISDKTRDSSFAQSAKERVTSTKPLVQGRLTDRSESWIEPKVLEGS
jgi:hypothetical protein